VVPHAIGDGTPELLALTNKTRQAKDTGAK
jgi:hypothetical protein